MNHADVVLLLDRGTSTWSLYKMTFHLGGRASESNCFLDALKRRLSTRGIDHASVVNSKLPPRLLNAVTHS